MCKQSDDLRQQAQRAKRLAETASDFDISESLWTLAELFEEDAARLDAREQRVH
jgi:hypothetical protein